MSKEAWVTFSAAENWEIQAVSSAFDKESDIWLANNKNWSVFEDLKKLAKSR